MKIEIYAWHCSGREMGAIKAAGYDHRQIVEGDPFEIAKQLYGRGVNVMVARHNRDDETAPILIGVADDFFSQR